MFKDEFPKELASLKAAPHSQARERADLDPETTLSSGRSIVQSLELLDELADTLHARWRRDEFQELPGPVRNNLLNTVPRLLNRLNEYANNQTGPQEIDNEIDALHQLLWQNGVLDTRRSKELYEQKNKELERLKDKGRRINRELVKGLTLRDELKAAHILIEERKAAITKAAEAVDANLLKTQEAGQASEESQSSALTSSTETKRIEVETTEVLNRVKSTESEVVALSEKVKLFFGEIETEQQNLKNLHDTTDKRVTGLEGRSESIVTQHEELQEEIEEQLQKATGVSLFHAFETRRKQITTSKWIWATISVSSLVATVLWSIFLAQSAASLDTVFFVKFAGTVPVLILVSFCLKQYGRERRAEEDYAFKSVLSLSLSPYEDLVKTLEVEGAHPEHVKFIIQTIGQIYEAPRLAHETSTKKADKSVLKSIKLISDLVEKLVNR